MYYAGEFLHKLNEEFDQLAANVTRYWWSRCLVLLGLMALLLILPSELAFLIGAGVAVAVLTYHEKSGSAKKCSGSNQFGKIVSFPGSKDVANR